ncbi:hypothetical protein [Spiroplasma culicicola]|uniref:Uncharacterized protein n=1 Tax=Spiroplasma culicicola AES-1 TaxID=1276246 RepID=W6A790_9MOLU|nr:hypothetical protein [Spiroplasma culicicola]AHI52846.1 hypothetical protein SCULI_v1c05050 [Spiroplasma culicicola AES-1]
MDKSKNNKLVEEYDFIDRAALYKELKNNQISNEDAQKFVESIFENYFLDNDNINFLQMNGYHFFSFLDDELCFCLSAKPYGECCKLNLKTDIHKEYVAFEKSLVNDKEYQKYLLNSQEIYQAVYKKVAKQEVCNYVSCSEPTVANNLYNFDFAKQKFVTTKKDIPFDNKYKMGDIFFDLAVKKTFTFNGFCKKHDELTNIKLSKDSKDKDIINLHYRALVFKAFNYKVYLNALKEEYLKYFNSIKEEGFKSLFIFRLKKVSNQTSSVFNTLVEYQKNLKTNNEIEIVKINLPVSEAIEVLDLVYPQICPNDFKLVNSVNNIFIQENIAIMNVANENKHSFTTFSYIKSNKALNEFFKQYLKIIKDKAKSEAAFVSNCALILTDNILFKQEYFDQLSQENKALFSALNKFRFENPNMGQEYIKMKFFAGFNKGNNFF